MSKPASMMKDKIIALVLVYIVIVVMNVCVLVSTAQYVHDQNELTSLPLCNYINAEHNSTQKCDVQCGGKVLTGVACAMDLSIMRMVNHDGNMILVTVFSGMKVRITITFISMAFCIAFTATFVFMSMKHLRPAKYMMVASSVFSDYTV